jgi:hypothetical protein
MPIRQRFESVVLIAVSLCFLQVPSAKAQIVRDNPYVTNGDVFATAYANNMLYLGGTFTKVGPATGSLVAIDAGTGETLKPYPRVLGTVQAIVPDANGGVYLGGSFTFVGGRSRHNLAHVDANGNVDSWAPDSGSTASGGVLTMALSGNTVYVGGTFLTLAGQPRTYLAAIDATTGALTTWNPTPNATVETLVASGNTLYAGGSFTSFGGTTTRLRIASFDIPTGNLTGFSSTVNNGIVYTIAPVGNFIYVGGNFTQVSFSSHIGIAQIDAVNGGAYAWNPNLSSGNVYDIKVAALPTQTLLYLQGDFSNIAGQPRAGIASIDAGTAGLSSFNPAPDGSVRSIAIVVGPFSVTTVYAGGTFSNIGGQPRSAIAALDPSTGVAQSWDPRGDGAVECLMRLGNKVYAGGTFASMGWVNRSGAAAFDAIGGAVTDWNPNVIPHSFNPPNVSALWISGHTIYIGGYFTGVGGQSRNGVAAVDDLLGVANAWDPNVGVDGTVLALWLAQGRMYIGGSFNTLGGVARQNLGAVDAGTGAIFSGLAPSITGGAVQALRVVTSDVVITPPKVFIGGYFTAVGGVTRNGLAQVSGDTGGLSSWNPNPNSGTSVTCMIIQPTIQGNVNRMWIGGYFTSLNGLPRNRIAQLDAAGNTLAWDPNANFPVHSMAVSGNTMYVGGSFYQMGGMPRKGLCAVDLTTGVPTGWTPDTNGDQNSARGGTVYEIVVVGSTVFAAGNFDGMMGLPHASIGGVSGDGELTAAETEEIVSPPTRIHAAPNPFQSASMIRFTMEEVGVARVYLFDATGRLVRRLQDGVLSAGERRLTWDGRSDAGVPVGSGTYFLRVETPTGTMSAKIFRVK